MTVITTASAAQRRLQQAAECNSTEYVAAYAHVALVKRAADAMISQSLAGQLYLSGSGWVLLRVPNALGRGAFDALDEPGVELPLGDNGLYNAHISVFRPDELERIGGADKITERGHMFHYTLGPLRSCSPGGWDEMSKVWFIEIQSPELQRLRRSYGLSGLPNDGKYQFHITIAVRRKHVLRTSSVSKV